MGPRTVPAARHSSAAVPGLRRRPFGYCLPRRALASLRGEGRRDRGRQGSGDRRRPGRGPRRGGSVPGAADVRGCRPARVDRGIRRRHRGDRHGADRRTSGAPAGPFPGLQTSPRRRSGTEYWRHGRLQPRPFGRRRRRGRDRGSGPGPGRSSARGRRDPLPRRPLRRPHADQGRPKGARVQLPVRRS